MTAQLISTVHRLTHERNWSVESDHPDGADLGPVRMFLPPCNGQASLKACLTWLENRGFKPLSDDPAELHFVA